MIMKNGIKEKWASNEAQKEKSNMTFDLYTATSWWIAMMQMNCE